ncbi:Cilia- and flagella-associated protein 47 [Kappamyces sp. JEL0680]|nr:Cilia- and flagella-associated protein 47 [Kappamyces sp. JEL0680]
MLKSDSTKPSKGEASKANSGKNAEKLTVPRRLQKLDPTIPSEGTRPTYFTALSTRSFESIKSLSRKPYLDSYMTLRVKPAKVLVEDYEPASHHECSITLHNYSRKIQYLSLGNTTTRLFRLAKDSPLQEFSIAPGLEKEIKVIFTAPGLSKGSVATTDTQKHYVDRLDIQVRGEDPITVPLEAIPPPSKLEIAVQISFGKVEYNPKCRDDHYALQAANDVAELRNKKSAIAAGWIRKRVPLTNSGKRPAKFSFEFDETAPLKMSPMSGILEPHSSCYIQIELLPCVLGSFNEKIEIRLDNKIPVAGKMAEQTPEPFFAVVGEVIDRKVTLSSPSGFDIAGQSLLDLGAVYFGQSVYLPIRITNQDDKKTHWSIVHSERNDANVPGKLKKLSASGAADRVPAFTATPSQGVLYPGQSSIIKVRFEPASSSQPSGFKNQKKTPGVKVFRMSMDLQTSSTGEFDGKMEAPVHLQFQGTAHPFLVQLSSPVVSFPRNDSQKVQKSSIVLSNRNSAVGAEFQFDQVAHFDIAPASGVLKPSESLEIDVIFRPNQYGHFQLSSLCTVTPLKNEHGAGLHSELHWAGENVLARLPLALAASWLPGVLPNCLERIDNAADDNKPSNIEWKQKVAHRQRYIDYIRGEGTPKPKRKENAPIKHDISALHYLDEERLRSNSADQRTGLIPPEPIATGLLGRTHHSPGDNTKTQRLVQMQSYFEKLAEPFQSKPSPPSDLGFSLQWQEASLSQKDLENVFASTAVLDFGDVTVHSTARLPLNFLNATPSKSVVHISHSLGGDSKLLDTSCLSVSPAALNLTHLAIAGLEVRMNSHVTGDFSASLNYIVNKRYVYHVVIKARIVPIALKCSVDRINLEIKASDLDGIGSGDSAKDGSVQRRNVPANYTTKVLWNKEFRFPLVTAVFEIENPGNYAAWFDFKDPQTHNADPPEVFLLKNQQSEGRVTIVPSSGSVAAKSKQQITVFYSPGTKAAIDRLFHLEVYDKFNGASTLVKTLPFHVSTFAEAADCQLLANLKQGLEFGLIPVASKEDAPELYDAQLTGFSKNTSGKFPMFGVRSFKIKNNSSKPYAFVAFASDKVHEVELKPNCGVVGAFQTLELVVAVTPLTAAAVEDHIVVNMVGGGKSYRIPIKYEGRRPHIEFTKFGPSIAETVIVQSFSSQSYQIVNKGSVFARLVVDLSKHPDLSLQIKEELKRSTSSASRRKSTSVALPATTTPSQYANRIGSLASKNIFIIDSQPGDRIAVDLQFSPKSTSSVDAAIPVYLLGSRSHNQLTTFDCPVVSRAVSSPIKLSVSTIDFGEKTIHSEGKVRRSPTVKTFEIENTSKEPIPWNGSIIANSVDGHVFAMEPSCAVLDPGAKQEIEVRFDPLVPAAYTSTLQLTIDYLDMESVFSIGLVGHSMRPSIVFSPPELFMPIVPLGDVSMAVLWITNNGCENGDIIAEVPAEIKRADIGFELIFPEGRGLKDGGKLPCVLKFQGKPGKPVSFTIRIPFQDPEFSKYYVTVHGTSDSSCFTLQAFSYKPLKFNSMKHSLATKGFQSPSGLCLATAKDLQGADQFWTKTFDSIVFWIHENLGISVHDRDFPEGLIASGGKAIANLVYSFSGKKFSSTLRGSTAEEYIKYTVRFYNEVITFLTMQGAMLSSVKAEFLLSAEDFQRSSRLDLESQKHRVSKKTDSELQAPHVNEYYKNFGLVSKEAWTTLLLQIVRMYILPPTNYSLLKSLPESEHAELLAMVDKSACCSEGVLLAWVAKVNKKFTGNDVPPLTFGAQFHDSVLVANLLLAYIPSAKKRFEKLALKPQSNEQLHGNAKLVVECLGSIFGSAEWQQYSPKRIYQGNVLDLQLLVLFLYQTLPHFVPQATIEFSSPLHKLQSKFIELSNPSASAVTYVAALTGANEIFLDELVFTIQPKSQYNLKVNFKSRFARQSEATLLIRSKQIGLHSISILSFKIAASVEPPTAVLTVKSETTLYCTPPNVIRLMVHNPFSEPAHFHIQMLQPRARGKPSADALSVKNSASIEPPAFTLAEESIQIAGGQAKELEVYFLPFEIGLHDCTLLFHDADVGEFMYRIEGKALGPALLDQVSWTCTSGIQMEKPLRLGYSNSLRDKAISSYLALNAAAKSIANKARSIKDRVAAAGERNVFQLPAIPLKYKVEYSSPYFSGPAEVTIKPRAEGKGNGMMAEEAGTELPVNFHPKSSGKYICRIVLSCVDYPDYRIYAINGLARSEGCKAELEFRAHAKETITQEIPIVNQTEEDWNIRAMLQGEHFWTPFMITAKAGSVTNFPIDFRPSRRCDVNGSLILTNAVTNQKYTYNLKGIGLDPEPQEVLQISCSAREPTELHLKVPNDLAEDCVLDVITDLPVSSGKKKLTVPGQKSAMYSLEIRPLLSGQFSKFVKFVNKKDDTYTWYSIQLAVKPAAPDYTIHINSFTRESCLREIEIKNPLANEAIQYAVTVTGAAVDGPSSFTVEAGQPSGHYKFTYCPLIPGNTTGQIKFTNAVFGEFTYALQLDATNSPPVEVETMVCPLGKSQSSFIALSNPLNKELVISALLAKSKNFQLFVPPYAETKLPRRLDEDKKSFVLGPFETAQVQVAFWPSEVGNVEACALELFNPLLGSIQYNIYGKGTFPVPMEPCHINCTLGEAKTGMIDFFNPFLEATPFQVSLLDNDDNAFTLVTPGSVYTNGLESALIQLTYRAAKMQKSHANVVVEVGDKYRWVYPVIGVPEVEGVRIHLKSRSRESAEAITEIQLSHFDALDAEKLSKFPWHNVLSVGFESDNAAQLGKILLSKVLEATVVDQSTLGLKVYFRFSPIKPLESQVFIVFTHILNGSKWKFPINLLATMPRVDDTIIIQGAAKKIASVRFSLKNPLDQPLPFKAYFLNRKGAAELEIHPQEGVMVPELEQTAKDNQFTVSYNPQNNGKSCTAIMVVETAEFALFYEIRGVTPVIGKRK